MQKNRLVFVPEQCIVIMLMGLFFSLCQSPAFAASVHLSHSVEESGAVSITAQGSFASCHVCNSNGENCHTVDSGSVSLHRYCSDNGHGSVSCTSVLDRGSLHGSHTFTGSASDCKGTDSDSLTITFDNTPSVMLTSPRGTVRGAFDISGTVQFKPTLNNTKGIIFVYFDNSGWSYRKVCTETNCSFSYREDNGKLYDLNHGEHKITVRAVGGGATKEIVENFTVDNMPEIDLESPKDNVRGAFDIKGVVHFQPSSTGTHGTIFVYFDNSGWCYRKVCTETDCSFSYLDDNGKLYDLSHGEHKITVKAIGGGATNDFVQNFTVDNIPEVDLESPKGTVHGAFDIKGVVHFQPSSTGTHGTIFVYFDNSGWCYRKVCTETDCSFSYLDDNGKLYDLSHGEHKITVKAIGGGATNDLIEMFMVDNMPTITIMKPIDGLERYPLIAQGLVRFHPVLGDIKGTIRIYVDNGQQYSKNCTELSCDFMTMLSISDNTASKVHVLKVRATSGGATIDEERSFYFEDIESDLGCFNISNDQCSPCAP